MESFRKGFDIFKTILALVVLISQFYIMWYKGYYLLFFIFLVLILLETLCGDVICKHIIKQICHKYGINEEVLEDL